MLGVIILGTPDSKKELTMKSMALNSIVVVDLERLLVIDFDSLDAYALASIYNSVVDRELIPEPSLSALDGKAIFLDVYYEDRVRHMFVSLRLVKSVEPIVDALYALYHAIGTMPRSEKEFLEMLSIDHPALFGIDIAAIKEGLEDVKRLISKISKTFKDVRRVILVETSRGSVYDPIAYVEAARLLDRILKLNARVIFGVDDVGRDVRIRKPPVILKIGHKYFKADPPEVELDEYLEGATKKADGFVLFDPRIKQGSTVYRLFVNDLLVRLM